MAATIKDIAKETGLGLATISKYLNGGNVLPENRGAIERAIKELNYSVNVFAQGLKTGRSKTIGAVLPGITNSFFMHIIAEMENELKKENYAVLISDCGTDKQQERESVNFLISKNVEGIVSFPLSRSGKHLAPALENNIPVLLLDRLIPKMNGKVDSIGIDNVSISREATQLLVENGHRNIGIIAGPKGVYTSDRRLQGYYEIMEESGFNVNPDHVLRCEYSVKGGFTGFKNLMKKGAGITAVYVNNHDMTLGALMAAREEKYKIPGDLSFLGFDSMDWAKIVLPKLTIVEQPMAEIGRYAAEIMLKRLKYGDMARQTIILSARLNIGDSIKRI